MTVPAANGRPPNITDRADVRRRMRVVPNPPEAPPATETAPSSAYTRAIPREPDVRPTSKPSKLHNFASQHGGEAWQTFTESWPLTERPSSLGDVAQQVFPCRGEIGSWMLWLPAAGVGVFRLAVCVLAWLAVLAVDGRKRAAVTFAVLLLALTVHLVADAVG